MYRGAKKITTCNNYVDLPVLNMSYETSGYSDIQAPRHKKDNGCRLTVVRYMALQLGDVGISL